MALQVVDERAHDAGRQFGAQAQASVPVGEGVHARDDLVARLAQEQFERLENRRLDALIAELLEGAAQAGFEAAEACVSRRQDVVRASDALDRGCRAVAEHVHVMCKCTSAYTVPGGWVQKRYMHAPQNAPVRLLIVDRQPVVTPEVRARLGREANFAVVGRVGSAVEATAMLRAPPMDMVLVESTLAHPGAVELGRSVRFARPKRVG